MTRRLTQQIVNEAANLLFQQNKKRPSNREVYAHIGFGSNTTLTEFMAVWRNEYTAHLTQMPTLPDSFIKQVQSLQMGASKEIQERYCRELEHLRESEQALLLNCREKDVLIEHQSTALREIEHKLHVVNEKNEEAVQKQSELHQQLEQERKAAETLRIQAAKFELQEAVIERLQTEVKEHQAEVRRLRQTAYDAQVRAAVFEERADCFEKWTEMRPVVPQ